MGANDAAKAGNAVKAAVALEKTLRFLTGF
jgi:hypothetical protein